MLDNEWEETMFNRIFDNVFAMTVSRLENDKSFTKDDVRVQLEDLCILEGQDQYGRGRVGDLDIEASIAAFQHILQNYDSLGIK